MTKLLDHAMQRARQLSDEEQDAVALAVLAMADRDIEIEPLDDESRAAIRRGLEQARRGEFVPDEEIEAIWKQHDL
jgi:predicted transcriptional regulator